MYLKIPRVNKDVLAEGPALTPPGNARIYAQFYGCFLNSVTQHTTPQPDRGGHCLSLRLWMMCREICTGGDGTAGKST